MKIRTDFVTNSSSSSFAIELAVQSVDGNQFHVKIAPDDGGGNGTANLNCSALGIMNASSVHFLIELLRRSLSFDAAKDDNDEDGLWNFDEDEDGEDEEDELWGSDEDEEYIVDTDADGESCVVQWEEFLQEIQKNITDVSQIESMQFKRIWNAWGEAASCLGANIKGGYVARDWNDLYDLALAVCNQEGDAQEKAKRVLEEFLETCNLSVKGNWGTKWPTGFLGVKVTSKIKHDYDIEEFAKLAINDALPTDDYAEETVTIDMKSKKIQADANYIFRKNRRDDDNG